MFLAKSELETRLNNLLTNSWQCWSRKCNSHFKETRILWILCIVSNLQKYTFPYSIIKAIRFSKKYIFLHHPIWWCFECKNNLINADKNANLVSRKCEKTTGIPCDSDFLALLETSVSVGNLRPLPGLTPKKEFPNLFVHLSPSGCTSEQVLNVPLFSFSFGIKDASLKAVCKPDQRLLHGLFLQMQTGTGPVIADVTTCCSGPVADT